MNQLQRSSFLQLREIFAVKHKVLAIAAVGAICLVLLSVAHRAFRHEPQGIRQAPTFSQSSAPDFKDSEKPAAIPRPQALSSAGSVDTATIMPERMMAQAAELSLSTQDFPRSRSSLEEILDRHSGYIARLRMEAQPSGSVLSATLRIPSSELGRALIDLKSLGHVEREEQTADEVTQQRSDLQARLLSARSSLRRLEETFKQPSSKFIDEVEVQRQIARLRAEIDRLEAEQHALETRVAFSNVLFSLHEEHTAVAESLAAQFRTAAVEGLSDAAHTVAAIVLFLVEYGPSLLLWVVILILPARFLWKRSKQWNASESAPSQEA